MLFGVVETRLFALLNPFAAYQLLEGGFGKDGVEFEAFANYFSYAVNLLIPGLCLMWPTWLHQRQHIHILGL